MLIQTCCKYFSKNIIWWWCLGCCSMVPTSRFIYTPVKDLKRLAPGWLWQSKASISDAGVCIHTHLIRKKKDLVALAFFDLCLPGTGSHGYERTAFPDAEFFQPKKDNKQKVLRTKGNKKQPTHSDYFRTLKVSSDRWLQVRRTTVSAVVPEPSAPPPLNRSAMTKPIPKTQYTE